MGEAKRRQQAKQRFKTPSKPLYHYTIGRRLPFIQDEGLIAAEPHHSRLVWLTESTELDPTSCAALTLRSPFYQGDLDKFDTYVGGAFRIEVNPSFISGLKHFSQAPEVRYIQAKDNHGADPNQWWICRGVKPSNLRAIAKLTKTGWKPLDWTEINLKHLANLSPLRLVFVPA